MIMIEKVFLDKLTFCVVKHTLFLAERVAFFVNSANCIMRQLMLGTASG